MSSQVSFRKITLTVTLMTVLALLICATGCTQQSAKTTTATTVPTAAPATSAAAQATTAAPQDTSAGMANPASVACNQSGGIVEIKTDSTGGQYGMCTFANGTSCEEWALYKGEGCNTGVTTNATAVPTASAAMTTYTEKNANTTVEVPVSTRFAISLAENPTTGYEWNATVTKGLTLVSDNYQQTPGTENMTGAGGIRTWVLQGNEAGNQSFTAIYKRSWEATTGNETSFLLNINLVKA